MARRKKLECELEKNQVVLELVLKAWKEQHARDLPGYMRGILTIERRANSAVVEELVLLVSIATRLNNYY